ncbi:hypothetical protein EMPS_05405 [Entomortierella parvispora]|uniref:Uncharacterized protein n=1 Tax=Entomortierella parvispora TaxID=205924 RepID=A0A9P3HAE0_9FUNG|nr:hypothetical protein EMPS_05405 [Entomortierella parvispora]
MEPLPARHEPNPSSSRSSPQQPPTDPRITPSPPHSPKSSQTPTHDSPQGNLQPPHEFSSPRPPFENRGSLDTLAAAALKPLSDPFHQGQQNQGQSHGQNDNKRPSPPPPRRQRSTSPAQVQLTSYARHTHSSLNNHRHSPSSVRSRPLDFATSDPKSTQSRSRSTSPSTKPQLHSDQHPTHKALPSFQELSNGRRGDSSPGRHHYRDRSYQPSDEDSEENPSTNPRSGDHPVRMRGPGDLVPSATPLSQPNQDKGYKSSARSTMSISSLLGDSPSAGMESRPEGSSSTLGGRTGESLPSYSAADKQSKFSTSMEQDGVVHESEYEKSNGYSKESQEEQTKRAQMHRHSRHHAPDATPEVAPDMRDAAYRKYYYHEQREDERKEATQEREEQLVEEREATEEHDREKREDSMLSERTAHSERHQHRHHHHHHGHGPVHHSAPLVPAPPHIHAHGHHHHHAQSHILHQHQHQYQHRLKYGAPQHHHHHQHHHHKHQVGTPPTGKTSAFSYVPKALGLSLNPRLKVNATQVYISYLIQLDQMQRAQHLMRSSEKRKSVQEPTESQLENGAPPHKQHQGAHVRSLSLNETTKAAQVVARRETVGHGTCAMSPVSEATAHPARRRSRSIESPDIAISSSEIGDRRLSCVSQLQESEPPSPHTHGHIHTHGHPGYVHSLAHHHHHHPHLHPYPPVHGHGHAHARTHAHAHLHPHPHPYPHLHTHPHPHTAPVLPAHVHPAQHHHHIIPTKSETGSPGSPSRGSTSPIVHRHHGAHHHHHPHHHPYHPNHPNHQHHFHHYSHPNSPHTHGHGRGLAHSHSHNHSHTHGRHTHTHSFGSSSQSHVYGHASHAHSSQPDEGGAGQSPALEDTSMSPPLHPIAGPEGPPVIEMTGRTSAFKASPSSTPREQGSPPLSSPRGDSQDPSREQANGISVSVQSLPLDSRPDVNDN